MNVKQLVAAVRDNLQAGGGANTTDMVDSFWSDSEIVKYVGFAMDAVWMEINKSNEDFFMKIATVQLTAGSTEYALPPDFYELKLLRATDSDQRDISFLNKDMADPLFRRALQNDPSDSTEFYFIDIINKDTLKIAPPLGEDMNVELHYIYRLAPAQTYQAGTVDLTNGDVNVSGTGVNFSGNVYKDWELIIGAVDPNATYPVVSADPAVNTALILDDPYNGNTVLGSAYILASPVDIDREHRPAIEAHATAWAFSKGTKPNATQAELWGQVYASAIALSKESTEKRQLQDPQFVTPYDPNGYI